MPVLLSLIDIYFQHCHNQPYSFFHESTFRRRVVAEDVPPYLLLAMSATAARYSNHIHFQGAQMEAVSDLSRAAWHIILDRVFATNQESEIAAAQATALLAVIDFTGIYTLFPLLLSSLLRISSIRCTGALQANMYYAGGHHRLGWVKIGLAIRLVQSLHLNIEPDSSLSPSQQEESRRVFWSVYLLDKFVSCGRSRPPSILDVDCTVALPCSEERFLMEAPSDAPTLALMREIPGNLQALKDLDNFAILVLMCSTLGMTVRDTFQQDQAKIPCWDCRSNFAQISSLMMSFEAIHTNGSGSLDMHIVEKFGTHEGYNRQRVGHFIWARGVYHLYGCLLYHPVNLYGSRLAHGSDFPLSFAKECLDRCSRHAAHLTGMLQTVLTTDCCARGSFLGYMATCASSIHKIYIHSPDQAVSSKAKTSLDVCQRFLEHQPIRWVNYTMMATAVREFDIDPTLARVLIDPLYVATEFRAEPSQLDAIWNIIDYGLLTEVDDKKQRGSVGLSPLSAALEPVINRWSVY